MVLRYIFLMVFFLCSHVYADLPDFMVLGVTKCATTSLFRYLSTHKDIKRGPKKEVHFFDMNYAQKLTWYKNQLPAKEAGKIIGEATPSYFWKPECLARIARSCPDTKFIVIMRDPVKRMISDYTMLVRQGKEKLSFEHAIKNKSRFDRYYSAGMYSKHIKRWLSVFPADQFLFLISDDLYKNPADEVNRVFKFLGVEEYTLPEYPICHVGGKKPEISPELLASLYAFYEPYTRELEEFLGRTLPWRM